MIGFPAILIFYRNIIGMTLRITDFYLRGWSVKLFRLLRRVVEIMMIIKECRMMMKERKRKRRE